MQEISYPKTKNIIESLLFVAKKPLTASEIAEVIEVGEDIIKRILEDLCLEYTGKGLQILKIANGFQLCTNEQNAEYVKRLLNSASETTLSDAALETLAIVAYKQPITRQEIENIRGVISDATIKTLLDKRLIAEVGRGDSIGRPIIYGTTTEFLRHFGLKDLSDLPKIEAEEEITSKTLEEKTQ